MSVCWDIFNIEIDFFWMTSLTLNCSIFGWYVEYRNNFFWIVCCLGDYFGQHCVVDYLCHCVIWLVIRFNNVEWNLLAFEGWWFNMVFLFQTIIIDNISLFRWKDRRDKEFLKGFIFLSIMNLSTESLISSPFLFILFSKRKEQVLSLDFVIVHK